MKINEGFLIGVVRLGMAEVRLEFNGTPVRVDAEIEPVLSGGGEIDAADLGGMLRALADCVDPLPKPEPSTAKKTVHRLLGIDRGTRGAVKSLERIGGLYS